MLSSFFAHANYWAILVATVTYFVLGSLWFSALFGKAWSAEVASHGVTIKDPSKSEIGKKMLQTFIGNLLAVMSSAYLVFATRSHGWLPGLKLGLLCGIGFAGVGVWIAYLWESRSIKLLLIDVGYAVVGITIACIILSGWR